MDPMMQQGAGGMPPGGGKTKTLGLGYNIAGLLCYLPVCGIGPITSLIWIFTEPKENKFLRFHAIQALLIYVTAVVLGVGFTCLGSVSAMVLPESVAGIVAMLIGLVNLVAWLGIVICLIMGMVKAYGNQIWKIPGLGGFAESRA
jgi:uncharacterized membrane protein